MGHVVVLIPEPRESGLRQTLASLSSHGYLREFLIMAGERRGELVSQSGLHDVDVLDYLASRSEKVDSIDVIFMHLGGDLDVAFRKVMTLATDDLVERCSEMGIGIRRGTLSIAPDSRLLDPIVIEPLWDFNLVGVPEDWTGDTNNIMVPLPEERLPFVASGLVCSVAGLWAWEQSSPLQLGAVGNLIPDPPILLCRAVTRVVSLGNLTQVFVSRALDPNLEWPVPSGCVETSAPNELKKEILRRIEDADALGFNIRPFEETPIEGPKRLGLLDTIRLWLRNLAVSLLGKPREWFDGLRERILKGAEDFVQSRTFKNGSTILARVNGRHRPDDLVIGATSLREEIQSLVPDLPEPEPTPEVWKRFLGMLSSVVDGGTHANRGGFEMPTEHGLRAVFGNRDEVCVLPAEPEADYLLIDGKGLGTSGQICVRSYDALGAARILSALEKDAERTDETKDPENAEAKTERDAQIRALSDWRNRRRNTLLWILGEHLAAKIQTVADEAASVQARAEKLPDEIRQSELGEERARKKSRRRARLGIALFVVALLLTLLNPIFIPVGVFTGFLAVLLLGLPYVAAFGVLGLWYSSAKDQVRRDFRLREQGDELERLIRESRHWWNELWRLQYLHLQLLDWSEIMEAIIRRPYGATRPVEHVQPVDQEIDALSIKFGIATLDEEAVGAAQLALRESVAGPGWLTAVVDVHLREFEEMYSKYFVGVNRRTLDPLEDVSPNAKPTELHGLTIYPPRRHFLEFLKSDRSSEALMDVKAASLREHLHSQDLEKLVESVSVRRYVRLNDDKETLTIREFLGHQQDLIDLPNFERHLVYGDVSGEPEIGRVFWSAIGFKDGQASTRDHRAISVQTSAPETQVLIAVSRVEVSAERYRAEGTRLFADNERHFGDDRAGELPAISAEDSGLYRLRGSE